MTGLEASPGGVENLNTWPPYLGDQAEGVVARPSNAAEASWLLPERPEARCRLGPARPVAQAIR